MSKKEHLVIYVSKVHHRGVLSFTVRCNQSEGAHADNAFRMTDNLDVESGRLATWFNETVLVRTKAHKMQEFLLIFNREYRVQGSKDYVTMNEPLTEREIRLFFTAVGGGLCKGYSGE